MASMNQQNEDLNKLHQEYLKEIAKLQLQQRKILADYAKKLQDIKLGKIRGKLNA